MKNLLGIELKHSRMCIVYIATENRTGITGNSWFNV